MDENRDLYKQTLSYNVAIGPYQCLAAPWWIRAWHPVYEPRHRCELKALNCGQDVFAQIHADIFAAERSVDIVTWGFDPGMVLIRQGSAENGMRFGDLLKLAATRTYMDNGVEKPFIVRLLLWHDDALSHSLMTNNPGYYGWHIPSINLSPRYLGDAHEKYNFAWFDEVRAGHYPNIHLRVRKVPLAHVQPALAGETYDIGLKGVAAKIYASHHQKMVLIDYEAPARSIGYVMGHNSTTDFWDTATHKFQDPLRETIYSKNPCELDKDNPFDVISDDAAEIYWKAMQRPGKPTSSKKMERVTRFMKEHSSVAKPYQDVSLRVRGPILHDLNHNFCQGWTDSTEKSATLKLALQLTPPALPLVKAAEAIVAAVTEKNSHLPRAEDDFIKQRKALAWSAFKLGDGKHSAQLIRTQPMYGEKGIKECYANLTRLIRHYMFIQNQYVQYEAWATQLKKCVAELRSFGAGYAAPIYVFILTSTPESKGMDRPTYSVAKELGQSHTMPVEHKEAVEMARRGKARMPINPQELAESGINVVMGSLWTCEISARGPAAYEEIYIHSKVAIVDDAAFTLGSANLNVRSMALDSELNVLSQAMDVAYDLRTALFNQCTGAPGPRQFGDMKAHFNEWTKLAKQNLSSIENGLALKGQLVQFHVEREPGSPII